MNKILNAHHTQIAWKLKDEFELFRNSCEVRNIIKLSIISIDNLIPKDQSIFSFTMCNMSNVKCSNFARLRNSNFGMKSFSEKAWKPSIKVLYAAIYNRFN